MATATYNAEDDNVNEIMRHARRLIDSGDCRIGKVERVIVLLNGNLHFTWQYGKGITFPNAAELAKAATKED